MSNMLIKKELRQVIRNSGHEVNSNMICSLVRIINMKYSNIDNGRITLLANEIINERRL